MLVEVDNFGSAVRELTSVSRVCVFQPIRLKKAYNIWLKDFRGRGL